MQEEKSQQEQMQPVVQPVAAGRSQPRHRGVTIAAIVGIILSLLAIFYGAILVIGFHASGAAHVLLGSFTMPFVVAYLVIGVITLISFITVLKMKIIGWKMAIIAGMILLIMQIILFLGAGILNTVVWAIILGQLLKNKNLFV
jgi:hypothetical protein